MIDQGADIRAEVSGETPLGWAVLRGNLEVTQYLLQRGADIRQRTGEGDIIVAAETADAAAEAYAACETARGRSALVLAVLTRPARCPKIVSNTARQETI